MGNNKMFYLPREGETTTLWTVRTIIYGLLCIRKVLFASVLTREESRISSTCGLLRASGKSVTLEKTTAGGLSNATTHTLHSLHHGRHHITKGEVANSHPLAPVPGVHRHSHRAEIVWEERSSWPTRKHAIKNERKLSWSSDIKGAKGHRDQDVHFQRLTWPEHAICNFTAENLLYPRCLHLYCSRFCCITQNGKEQTGE